MKKLFLCLALASIFVFGLGVNSYALLILSGDGNITEDLLAGAYDNQQFFSNVLEGGTNVGVLNETGWGGAEMFDTNINSYYNSLSGVSSSIISGTITDELLLGIDLFVAATPDHAFTTSELNVLDNFLNDGNSIFFLGENNSWDQTSNLYINDALAHFGSGLSINYGTMFDGGYHVATGSQIASDVLTSGVTAFQYAAPDSVNAVNGGTSLFYGTGGQAFVAYEDTAAPVPEPSTILLMGAGLLGLVGYNRKRFSKKS